MGNRLFYAVIGGFVIGIFTRSFVDFGISFSLFLILLALVLFIFLFLKEESPDDRNLSVGQALEDGGILGNSAAQRFGSFFTNGGIWTLLAVFLFAAGLGMLRYDAADRSGPKAALNAYLGQQISLEGVVGGEPDERERVTRLIVLLTEVSEESRTSSLEKRQTSKSAKTKILVTTSREPKYAYGDRLLIRGKIERPKNFADETTLREADYRRYLAKDGIYYETFLPAIEILAQGEGNWIVSKLFAFKNSFIDNINRSIPQPHAALLAGLVVGAKQSLGKKLLDDFRATGVIHIVVLSGYNITIIAYFIEWLLSRLRKNIRLTVASAAMILFALTVGASATVVRATIMALLVILARSTGRIYEATRALLVAGFLMLLHNPKILVFDVSFELSFLATVGLIYFSPLVESRVKWVTEKWKMREIAIATIATQLFVLPFLLYKTGVLSLVSLPVNLLILTAIPFTMLFGFLAGMAGFVASVLAAPFVFISYILLSYELLIVGWFAGLPFAAVTFASFPLWLAVFWYAVYAAVLFAARNQRRILALGQSDAA